MKRHTVAVVVASLTLLTACGSEPGTVAADADEPGSVTDGASQGTVAPTDAATGPTAGAATSAGEPSEGSAVLVASVGTPEDPEAFVISLTDESGEPVTSVPAGDYTIEVIDPAETHNFHLTGDSVDESTSVPETVETTWEVTLEEGEYTYTCDPHPRMTGTFTVTA